MEGLTAMVKNKEPHVLTAETPGNYLIDSPIPGPQHSG